MLMKKIFTLIAAAFVAASVNAGEIFSFMLKEGAPEFKIAGGSTAILEDEYSEYCTITTGGHVEITNAHADEKAYVNAQGYVTLNGSGGSYLYVGLPTGVSLKAGDIIKLVDATQKGGGVGFSDSKVTTDNMNDANEYTVTATDEGKTGFYIWRGASKPTFKGVTVTRNEGQTIAPAISVVNGQVVMTSGTAGASIYYGTQTGVTPSNGTLYTEPLSITSNVTYYAVAIANGLEVSKESSKVVEFYTIAGDVPAATLAATLKAPEIIADGGADVVLVGLGESADSIYTAKPAAGATLSNSATWNSNPQFEGLVKVNKVITVSTKSTEKNIAGIKVIGISNVDDSETPVTAANMKYTTDCNLLPARNVATTPGTIEFVATTPAKSFDITFGGQGRVMFEVYAVEATGVAGVKADEETAPAVKKFVKDGKLVIVNGNAEYNAAGAQIK